MYDPVRCTRYARSQLEKLTEEFLRSRRRFPVVPSGLDVDEMPDDPARLKRVIIDLQFQNQLMRELIRRGGGPSAPIGALLGCPDEEVEG